MPATSAKDVLDFWYNPEVREKRLWFKKDAEFDEKIRAEFSELHEKAANEQLADWMNQPESALALIILLDQFSRNMFRNDPKSFAYDKLALKYAKEAIAKGLDKKLPDPKSQLSFVYMPFMHSEDAPTHEEAVKLFQSVDFLKGNYDFELKHKGIIDKFGRYPHRNEILGRKSTSEELEFLKTNTGF